MTSSTLLRNVKLFTFVMVASAAIAVFSTNQANAQFYTGRGISAGSLAGLSSGYNYGYRYGGFGYTRSPYLTTPRTTSIRTSYPRTTSVHTSYPRTTSVYGGSAYGFGYRGY